MNEWARGKYKGRANFVCVSCDGPELAQAMGERMKLKDCVNSVTASSRDGPYWGQLGCSGFIILSPGSQQVIAGKTMAFLDVRERAFRHVEAILDGAIQEQAKARIQNINSRPELNGQICQILYHDPQSGRQVVQLADGSELKLKPENLEQQQIKLGANPNAAGMSSEGS